MATGIYEEIWKLLKRYDFDIDFQLNNDLLCSLCNKILINAAVGPCGCKYCHQCIEIYLNGDKKYCPTQKIACKNKEITLKCDLKIDNIINGKISLLKVKCPKTFCQFTDELKNIPSHLKSHQSKCEFSEIGCVESRNHLDNYNSLHLNLLMNTLQNVQNEMEIIKEKCGKNENLINNLNMELIQIKEENNSLKSQLMTLEAYKEKCNNNEDVINNVNMELIQMKEENNYLKSQVIILQTINENQNTNNNQINTRFNLLDLIKIHISKQSLDLAPFRYEIKNFRNKINRGKCIYTNEFLSKSCGYTLQLRIHPKGDDSDFNKNLSIDFAIVEGKYDDMLSWPMKDKVKIAVMNQETDEIYVSRIFCFDDAPKSLKCIFFKPSVRRERDNNYFYGTTNLISLNELIHNKDLCKNDSIVVKCFVA